MKLKITIPFLVFSLFLISAFSYSQDKKIDITLTVDVDNINQNNIDETASFGQPAGVSNREFLTEVQIGDEVKWKIDVQDGSSGSAKLIKFKHESGKKFFKKDSIPVKFGRIKDRIAEGAGQPGDIEKYAIEFEIKKKGESNWEVYIIDPKLKIIQ